MTTMTKIRSRTFTTHACGHCGGAALYDRLDDEWRCLQCGREVVLAAAATAAAVQTQAA